MESTFRIGHGIDVHAFAEGRKLILGGVEIPNSRGLLGHSDADVLLHAIIDAIIGAVALGDIGSWFPDSDPKFKNASSADLFSKVWKHVQGLGYLLVNCDATVLLEEPRLRPYIERIQESVSALFYCDPAQISIKATTTEHLGFVGRGEGVTASAMVLLVRGETS